MTCIDQLVRMNAAAAGRRFTLQVDLPEESWAWWMAAATHLGAGRAAAAAQPSAAAPQTPPCTSAAAAVGRGRRCPRRWRGRAERVQRRPRRSRRSSGAHVRAAAGVSEALLWDVTIWYLVSGFASCAASAVVATDRPGLNRGATNGRGWASRAWAACRLPSQHPQKAATTGRHQLTRAQFERECAPAMHAECCAEQVRSTARRPLGCGSVLQFACQSQATQRSGAVQQGKGDCNRGTSAATSISGFGFMIWYAAAARFFPLFDL